MPELKVISPAEEGKGASGKPKKEKPTKAPKSPEDKPDGDDEADSLLQAVVTQQLGSGVRYRKKAAAKKHAAKRKSSKLPNFNNLSISFNGYLTYYGLYF